MTSQLAKQLHRLQDRPTNDAKLSKSFLFSNADAKQITREQVHELAIAGLRILMTIDNRLNIFLEPLFAASLIRKERAMYTTEENEVLNNHLRKLCVMLSPHLFLTAAQQVMEYLVRIFEVHTYNVKIVLSMFLPYHDHAIFTRALMLLDLRGSGFDFLQKNQLNGAVLPRQTLNIAAGENGKVMRLVCNVAADCIKYDVKNNGAFALFTGVATAVSTRADNEAVMRILLPYVVTFIDEPSPIATPAALIVLHTWCTEASLSTLTLAAILRPLIAGLNRSDFHVPLSEIIAVLGHVFLTQKVAIHDVAFTPILTILLSFALGGVVGKWIPSP